MSNLVEATIDGSDENDEVPDVPLPNIKTNTLQKVIEYCKYYITEEAMTPIITPLKSDKMEDLVQKWYAEFVEVDQATLFELVYAANFMDVKPLLDLTCLAVSIFIKGKSAKDIRNIFGISENFSPDEEAQLRQENQWCDQP